MKNKENHIRQNPIVLALQMYVVTLIFNFTYLVISLVADAFENFNNESFASLLTYDTASYLLLIVLQLFILFWLILRWYNNIYFVESDFLVNRTGIIFKTEKRFTLSTFRSLVVRQGFFGRLFRYGTVTVSSNDHTQKLVLYAVANPYEFADWLNSTYKTLGQPLSPEG